MPANPECKILGATRRYRQNITQTEPNVHDSQLLAATIDAIAVERPEPEDAPQNLCLDKGYDNLSGVDAAEEAGYAAHIRRIGEEKKDRRGRKRHHARRWVVERTLSWLQKCRAIPIRHGCHWRSYLGLIQLACALPWFRRLCKLHKNSRWRLSNIPTGSQQKIIFQNPHKYVILTPEVSRVLQKGGVIELSGKYLQMARLKPS